MFNRRAVSMALGGFVLGALCILFLERPQAVPAAQRPDDARAAAIAEQLRAECRQLVKLRQEEYRLGKVEFARFLASRCRLCEVELSLATTAEERRKVLADQLQLAETFEKLVVARHESGLASAGDAIEARIARLQIELALRQQTE